MSLKTINSSDIIGIEHPFKVIAGPGAGKTHWLIKHITNVIETSKRLGCYRKVACITYTNIAADTIIGRLNNAADRIEVSTIHSFIYNNILKPYMHFIAKDYDFEVKYMDGHDDHFVSRNVVKEWLDNHPQKINLKNPWSPSQLFKLQNNYEALTNWLSSIYYNFNGNSLEISIDNRKAHPPSDFTKMLSKKNCLDVLVTGLLEYKKLYWKNGKLHHDDVLFFGHQLIQKYPFILTVLRAKFPYFFIDEFQDTSPIQTTIIKMLAQKETIIGIIGDKAQSIYSFQGASSIDFDAFKLTGQEEYIIPDNRRSTNLIIDLLNHIRKDITQAAIKNIPGTKPVLIVGTKENAYAYAKGICGNETLITLSRENITVNAMQRQYNTALSPSNLLDDLYAKDNSDRFKVIKACTVAVELGREKRFKEAIKEMEKNFYSITNKTLRKKTAFRHLQMLLSKYEEFKDQPLYEFYVKVKSSIRPDIPALSTGGIKTFYETYTFSQMALFVDDDDEVLESRTIHKAKGDEFDNVLVIMNTDKELGYLLSPNLSSEEQRVRYVAISRAKEKLFINVPQLSPQEEIQLTPLFNIVRK